MPTISTACVSIPRSSLPAESWPIAAPIFVRSRPLSRLENAPSLEDAIRLTYSLVDQCMASYEREPASVILDIDDTCDVVHGLDIRFVVTNLEHGSPEWIYDSLYCARGQAENLIKLHKTQLASDRTSCRSAVANQVRLVLHTAAYWLMLTVRDAIPKARDLAQAEFATLRLRLIKIAARIVETISRVRLAFAAFCPEADLFRGLSGALAPLGP
jgi:hypothetical protein